MAVNYRGKKVYNIGPRFHIQRRIDKRKREGDRRREERKKRGEDEREIEKREENLID
jgi:hypothetical protein